MTPSNQIPAVCNYGTSAVYSDYPSPEQMRAGVVPLDSLPAAWWNKMWCASNCAINEARDMVGQLITELNSVLCQAGINPQAACTDQLYQSINKIRQTLATASVAGAVVSSSTASEVAVDPTTGHMTVNCLGNAASLSTSASTVVGAINELKSTYDCCFSDTATALGGKAPTSHASSATTYGVGSADNYGHLKISDTYTSVLAACSGVAASQMALACVYAVAAAAAAGNVSLGNTAGCALGTAAAGTAITAARSDHVHPVPACVPYAVTGGYLGERAALGCAPNCTYGIANIWNYCNDSRYYLIGTKYDNTACKYNVRVDYATSAGSATSATSAGSATNATNATKACCASCNGSGTAFGTAATCSVKAAVSTASHTDYNNNQGYLPTMNFLSYWNGAYNANGSSNLTYTSVGKLGSAAACAAGCFRPSNWTPSCVACAGQVYNRPTNAQAGSYSIFFYSGCNRAVGCAPDYYASCICGANGYYYGNICGNVCGTATSAGSATSATKATCAGAYYCDSDLYLCTYGVCTCSCCSYGQGRGFICNNNSSPVMFMMPVPPRMYACVECLCGYGCVCWYTKINGPRPFSLVQIEGKTSLCVCWVSCDSYNPGASCTKIPYRLLGYSN